MAGSSAVVLAIAFLLALSVANASFHPLSDKEKGFAEKLFLSQDGEGSLEIKYQTLRALQVIGRSRNKDPTTTCEEVSNVLTSSSASLKDTFYAAKISEVLECPVAEDDLKKAASNLLSSLGNSDALLDLHFTIGALSVIKNWINEDLALENAAQVLNNIKALGEADGTWKYTMNDDASSAKAAGIAFETLASLMRIAGSPIEETVLEFIKMASVKLFESVKKYDDGTFYFEEKSVDKLSGPVGSIATTSSVIRGIVESASVFPGKLKVPEEKVVGIANFLLSSGVHGSYEDAFCVLDALGLLDTNSVSVPLVLSVPSSVLSLTSKDTLEVSFTTVLGSSVRTKVTLVKAVRVGSKKSPVLSNMVLESDADNFKHRLPLLENRIDLGKYDLTFNVKPLNNNRYALGASYTTQIVATGTCTIASVEVGVLDSDTGSTEYSKSWDPSTKEVVSLFANHLQKLHFSLDVVSPLDELFTPHQVFLKLKHESHLEHLFLAKPGGKHLELKLDLLGLVEKLNYVSGVYAIELVVGDDSLENSIVWALGTVELDLPEPPEGLAKRNAVLDTRSTYGPKPEIAHMFRPAEKRAPTTISNAFFGLTLVPLLGFLAGLKLLNANAKGFPTSGLPLVAGVAFHVGIASILGLYVLFWVKFNLFETLKVLAILAVILTLPGHYLLSHLADKSPKVKTA